MIAKLSASWVQILSNMLARLRYPVHGLQMVAAYFGPTAPSGKVAITAALQAADELRRVERIAQRVRQLQIVHTGFARNSKDVWQHGAAWQPLREIVEKLLIVYDWSESFVVLNLLLKPMFDELFLKHFSDLALRENDHLLGQIFYSLNEDCQWHREWSRLWFKWLWKTRPQTGRLFKLGLIRGIPASRPPYKRFRRHSTTAK